MNHEYKGMGLCVCLCVLHSDVAAAVAAINLSGARDLLSPSWRHILLDMDVLLFLPPSGQNPVLQVNMA